MFLKNITVEFAMNLFEYSASQIESKHLIDTCANEYDLSGFFRINNPHQCFVHFSHAMNNLQQYDAHSAIIIENDELVEISIDLASLTQKNASPVNLFPLDDDNLNEIKFSGIKIMLICLRKALTE